MTRRRSRLAFRPPRPSRAMAGRAVRSVDVAAPCVALPGVAAVYGGGIEPASTSGFAQRSRIPATMSVDLFVGEHAPGALSRRRASRCRQCRLSRPSNHGIVGDREIDRVGEGDGGAAFALVAVAAGAVLPKSVAKSETLAGTTGMELRRGRPGDVMQRESASNRRTRMRASR